MYKYFYEREKNNMRSNKGITMMSLIIYITSFLLVTGIVAGVTAFFYGNSSLMTAELYSAADYNKLNLYLVKESEQENNRVKDIARNEAAGDNNSDAYYLEFTNGDRFTYVCLCEDVQSFKVNPLEYTSGKEVLSIMVEFTNKSYSSKYTMAQ